MWRRRIYGCLSADAGRLVVRLRIAEARALVERVIVRLKHGPAASHVTRKEDVQ